MSSLGQYSSQKIYSSIYKYYENYYRYELKLKHWEKRIITFRYNEEETVGKKVVSMVIENGISIHSDSSVLIVGCGTGAELFYVFDTYTKKVFGIDPVELGVEICNMKAAEKGLSLTNIVKGSAEYMPFNDSLFDVVLCFTVIEHVDDVKETFSEIHRVLKKNGKAFLFYPNYLYPEEPHFKILTFPPALIPHIARWHLKIKNRYSGFYETLNFISEPKTIKYLHDLGIDYSIIHLPAAKSVPVFIKIYCRLFGISKNQMIIIKKN